MSRRVLASQRCRAEITDKGEGVHASCAQIGDVRGRCGCLARNGRNRPRPGADPDRRAAADDRPFAKNGIENWEAMQIARDMINERGGINGRKVEYPAGRRHQPRTPRSARPSGSSPRTASRSRLGSFASPLAIAVSQAAERHGVFHWETDGRGRNHHPARLQAHVPGRAAGLRKYGQAAVDFVARRPGQAARTSRSPTCASRCCGKTARSESRSATASAPTPRQRASSWSMTKATTSSPPT